MEIESIQKKIERTIGTEFIQNSNEKWEHCLKKIFPVSIPKYCEWTDHESIAEVLDLLGRNTLNHVFFPTGEGLDLIKACPSDEFKCIELFFGKVPHIVKPRRLIFQKIDCSDLEWSYFFLESAELKPSGVYKKLTQQCEELVKLPDGKLLERMHWDEGFIFNEHGEQINLPDDAKLIIRCLSGNFALLAKGSYYNELSYEFSDKAADDFRRDIESLYDRVCQPELV